MRLGVLHFMHASPVPQDWFGGCCAAGHQVVSFTLLIILCLNVVAHPHRLQMVCTPPGLVCLLMGQACIGLLSPESLQPSPLTQSCPWRGCIWDCTGLTCQKCCGVAPKCPENVGYVTWRSAIIATPSQVAFLVGLQMGLVACLMMVSVLIWQ